MPAELLARLFHPRKQLSLPDWKGHDTRKHRPPVEEMGKEPRSHMRGIIACRWRSVVYGPFAVQGCSDGKGKMDMVAAKAVKCVVYLDQT